MLLFVPRSKVKKIIPAIWTTLGAGLEKVQVYVNFIQRKFDDFRLYRGIHNLYFDRSKSTMFNIILKRKFVKQERNLFWDNFEMFYKFLSVEPDIDGIHCWMQYSTILCSLSAPPRWIVAPSVFSFSWISKLSQSCNQNVDTLVNVVFQKIISLSSRTDWNRRQ